jgi:hypothetical protein
MSQPTNPEPTTQPDPPTPEPTSAPEPNADDVEKAYWSKFEKRLDDWFDRKISGFAKQQRESGKGGFSKFFAEMMGGPFTPSDKK